MKRVKYGVLLIILLSVGVFSPANAAVENVPVPAEMQQCQTDADCVIVETACDSCCDYSAVNKSNLQSYRASYAQECADYKGGVCDCIATNTNVICHTGACMMEISIKK